MTENKLEYLAIDLITNGPKVPGACVVDATGVTWTATTSSSSHSKKENGEKEDQSRAAASKKIVAPATDIKEINYSQVPGGVQVLLRVKPDKGSAKTIVLQGFRGADVKPLKEFVAAQVVVCCARKEAVVPEKLKAFVVKDGGNGRGRSASVGKAEPAFRDSAFADATSSAVKQ